MISRIIQVCPWLLAASIAIICVFIFKPKPEVARVYAIPEHKEDTVMLDSLKRLGFTIDSLRLTYRAEKKRFLEQKKEMSAYTDRRIDSIAKVRVVRDSDQVCLSSQDFKALVIRSETCKILESMGYMSEDAFSLCDTRAKVAESVAANLKRVIANQDSVLAESFEIEKDLNLKLSNQSSTKWKMLGAGTAIGLLCALLLAR